MTRNPMMLSLAAAVVLLPAVALVGVGEPADTAMRTEAAAARPATPAKRRMAGEERMCITPTSYCAVMPMPVDSPCNCPSLVHGSVPGYVELVLPARPQARPADMETLFAAAGGP